MVGFAIAGCAIFAASIPNFLTKFLIMNSFQKIFFVWAALCLICFASACNSDNDDPCQFGADVLPEPEFCTMSDLSQFYSELSNIDIMDASGNIFDYVKFEQLLRDSLDNQAKGWQFALIHAGGFINGGASDGMARDEDECYPQEMTACTKINIASTTKLLTAAAVLKLLDENGLSINDPVAPYLPSNWNVPAGTDTLRFSDFLRHRTGLQSTNDNFSTTLSFEGLRTFIEGGIQNPQSYNYLNANFALMRIVIPRLWKMRPDCPPLLQESNIDDIISQTYYSEYIRQKILFPAGVYDGYLKAEMADLPIPTLYYTNAADGQGSGLGDWNAIAGGGGWHLSASDLAKVVATLENGNSVLSSSVRDDMRTLRMGYFNCPMTIQGRAYTHGGDISGGGEVHGFAGIFPNNVAVALFLNSGFIASDGTSGSSNDLVALVRNIYDQCW